MRSRQRKTEQILCHSAISCSTPILDRVLFLIRVIAMTKLETLDGLVKFCVARPRRHLAKYARAAARRLAPLASGPTRVLTLRLALVTCRLSGIVFRSPHIPFLRTTVPRGALRGKDRERRVVGRRLGLVDRIGARPGRRRDSHCASASMRPIDAYPKATSDPRCPSWHAKAQARKS